MLNLLNIILLLFYGSVDNADFFGDWRLYVEPTISVTEYVSTDPEYAYATYLTFELDYYLTIYTSDFEIDSYGYEDKLIHTDTYEFELADSYITDLSDLSVYFEFSNIIIDYGVDNSNLSYIDISLTTYYEFYLTFNDGFSFDSYDENALNISEYTNFTIYNDKTITSDYPTTINYVYDFLDTYQDGYNVGYEDGYHTGYLDGEESGYEAGSNDLDNVFNGSWVEWLGNAITGFFALEIFPGFSLAGALGAILCAYIMMWILKVLAGG